MSWLRFLARTLLLSAITIAAASGAELYRPARDAEVLEYLPLAAARAGDAGTRVLREWQARDPSNLDLALRLAQNQIAAARAASDPRLWGQAQATLAPWWEQESPPLGLLLARAAIHQNRHDFAAAKTDLLRAVTQQPQAAQAWLDLASLQQATGDLAAAAESCGRIAAAGAPAIATVCQAGVDALTGRGSEAYAAIESVFAHHRLADQPAAVRTWAATLLAEIAERLARNGEAERWYRYSLAIDPTDSYTLAAYADFLLDRGRPADVVQLIAADSSIDSLLLRRVLAEYALDVEAAQRGIALLAARFDALRERGDRVHRREESRFRQALTQDPELALELALENWAVQKEPLDARIALEAAHAANRPRAAAAVAGWVEGSGLQDIRLAALLLGIRTP
ncbi:MAG: hypothetical protein JNN30_00500 [Rhodanobacteraceae bacterium]|nr:hypothetical protein [Rhodanobacteraceae bacterium]